MKLYFFSFLVLVTGFGIGYATVDFYADNKMKQQILSANVNQESLPPVVPEFTVTLSVSPLPTPTISPPPTITTSPTLTPTPRLIFAPTHLDPLFSQYAAEYHVEKELLTRVAYCESRFNSEAVNGNYVGLFQFASERWVAYRTQMGHDPNPDLRRNANESIKTAAYLIAKGKLYMWPTCSK